MIMAKRPDLRLRNLTNNPMNNQETIEKMRKTLTGRTQSEATKTKRAESLRRYYQENPTKIKDLHEQLEQKHLSKIRGKGWRKARLKALERDSHTCQSCGEQKKRLIVHHLDYKGKNLASQVDMNNELSNLITWCDKCHNSFHRHKSSDYKSRMARII